MEAVVRAEAMLPKSLLSTISSLSYRARHRTLVCTVYPQRQPIIQPHEVPRALTYGLRAGVLKHISEFRNILPTLRYDERLHLQPCLLAELHFPHTTYFQHSYAYWNFAVPCSVLQCHKEQYLDILAYGC
ncbi:hypothetical protein CC80DRAFT_178920 [Byssothecium circinans]|uniref:Uncharacterized protein n=1 Tax=Byssothecium circinans TaxID=147558 RepID=A0A6A5TIZ8_9PLEO|nr:hypothetical protein CC80DRAFT_178920 [Byssothecium circinans]